METAETILLIVLVLNSLALIVLIMLQQGQGADVGAAFGSGGANTVFGSAGSATFLTRLTTWLAIAFFAITFGLAWIAKEKATGGVDLGLDVPADVMVDEPQVDDAGVAPLDADMPQVDDAAGGAADSGDVPATGS